MSIKITRGLVLLIIILISITYNDNATALQTVGSTIYLPIISLDRSHWIGPDGGAITTIIIDPTNPQTVYAGTWGSGVYQSLDGGINWRSSNQGLNNLYINSMEIDRTQPSIIYAGTYKNQVYKSQDGGNTWTWIGLGMQDEAIVYSIAVDPQSPATVYAGTRGISNNGNPPWNGVLYKSLDAGGSWFPILMNVGGEDAQDWVYSIAINPTENNSVYVATHEHGPFRTNNYGATWFPVQDGINDDSGRAIVINPNTSEGTIVYYGVWHFDSVYKSFNGGNDWLLANHDIAFTKVYGMAIDPQYPDNVFLATFSFGVLKTTDAGDNWIPSGLHDDFIYQVSIDPVNTINTYAGTAGDGLFKSINGGISWQHSDHGINNSNATKVIFSAADPYQLYASLYGAGVVESGDRGLSWSEMNAGLEDKYIHSLAQDPTHPWIIFALTDTGGLYRNDLNSGDGWVSSGLGLPLVSSVESAYPSNHPFATRETMESVTDGVKDLSSDRIESENLLVMSYSPSEPQIAYLGTGGSGVYKSTDGGVNWQPAGLAGETIQSLAVDSSDSNLLFAASTSPGTMKLSANGGSTWADIGLEATCFSLAASPTVSGSVYAGTDDGIYHYLSSSWAHLGLFGLTVTAVTVDANQPNKMYAGTTSGAFYSENAGETWAAYNTNLVGQTIQSIDIKNYESTWVYFSTKTHGIFQVETRK